MPNPDELRVLIQQVEDYDGPLRLDGVWICDAESRIMSLRDAADTLMDQDMIAGILRHSLNEAGLGVTHDADAGQLGGTVQHTVIVYGEHEEVARTSDDSILVAHLEAWLEAYEAGSAALDEPAAGLVGRQEATDGA